MIQFLKTELHFFIFLNYFITHEGSIVISLYTYSSIGASG